MFTAFLPEKAMRGKSEGEMKKALRRVFDSLENTNYIKIDKNKPIINL